MLLKLHIIQSKFKSNRRLDWTGSVRTEYIRSSPRTEKCLYSIRSHRSQVWTEDRLFFLLKKAQLLICFFSFIASGVCFTSHHFKLIGLFMLYSNFIRKSIPSTKIGSGPVFGLPFFSQTVFGTT